MTDKHTPFDFLNAINTKAVGELDIDQYNPFMVNRGLSFFQDTILWANEMNSRSHIDKKLQFDFLLNTVSKKKRFSKWFKSEKIEDVELLMDYYKVNRMRAQEMLHIISEDQINVLKDKLFLGGRK